MKLIKLFLVIVGLASASCNPEKEEETNTSNNNNSSIGADSVAIMFQVNMANMLISPSGVHLAGSMQGWDPDSTKMADLDEDGIYSVVLVVPKNDSIYFKYINGNEWGTDEVVPENCGVMNEFGGFNRAYIVGSSSQALPVICFGECEDC